LLPIIGWASVDISQDSNITFDDKAVMLFNQPHSFESKCFIKEGAKAHGPVCIMNAGYSSGWFSEVTGENHVTSEISCQANGNDVLQIEICFFTFRNVFL
jgi:two-component system cell cycle sensor histidine kinase/response regulator CckA